MTHLPPNYSLGTHAIHTGEGRDALGSHVQPIYQTSTFFFPDVDTATAVASGAAPGYVYTRSDNPTVAHLARKYAVLEGLGLIRANPHSDPETLVKAIPFASGMAAISGGVLARVRSGETLLAQHSLYNTTYQFFTTVLPRYGIEVVWIEDLSPEGWEAALTAHPKTTLVYIETPSNPAMLVVDIAAVVEIAHRHGAWVIADNTFATPYCQRPLELGLDIVAHSTTKYLSGHGTHLGGVIVSPHIDFMKQEVMLMLKTLGGAPSPMDCWLGHIGLKTFALRMERHCLNAMAVAQYLAAHPKVAAVYYPGLKSHSGHIVAQKQMIHYGGMISFELKGGAPAAKALLKAMRLASTAASLGNVDSLIQLSAAMNYAFATPEERARLKISDGLIRYSVGIEEAADVLDDLDQALAKIS